MIQGLYETHLFVESLDRSIIFYRDVLGLEQCYAETGRGIAFFWIGKPKGAMLGLWEKPASVIQKRHFAFRCDQKFILNEAVGFLKANNLKPYNFLKDGTEMPMVFAWMPAVSIYFDDPDGHYLEFIAVLDGQGKPDAGVISYEEWQKINISEFDSDPGT